MLNLQTNYEIITVTNKSKGFLESEYKDQDFEIKLKTLSNQEQFKIIQENTTIKSGKEVTDFSGVSLSQLKKMIISWKGIGSEGKELKKTDANIEAIFNYAQDFIAVLLNEISSEKSKKKVK